MPEADTRFRNAWYMEAYGFNMFFVDVPAQRGYGEPYHNAAHRP